MLNYFETTLNVTRIDICDLLLACLAARDSANDGGQKWINLHSKLQTQLEKLDNQLYEIQREAINNYYK